MLKKIVLTCLLLVMVLPGRSPASESSLTALLTDLKETAARTESLSSQFEQKKRLEIFAEELTSQGRFVYRNPDRLRWELLTPVASGFVLTGLQGQRWNGLSGEKSSFSVAQDPIMGMIAQQLLAWARVDLDWLESRYRMELESEQPVRLKLYPLDDGEAGFIDYLNIVFADDRRYVAEVLLMEQGGDRTLLQFHDVVVNGVLPPDAFEVPELQ